MMSTGPGSGNALIAPWQIVKGGGSCGAEMYALMKTQDGSTVHCHDTLSDAKKQLAALYVADKKKRSAPMGRNGLTMVAEQERRRLPSTVAVPEIRTVGDGDPASDRFTGYAVVWNKRAAIGNPATVGFYEECSPGMVTKTLQEGDQRFLVDHLPNLIVSRVSAGTLDLRSDTQGLPIDSAIDERVTYARDLKFNVLNKNVTGMSFGFKVVKDDWKQERVGESDVEVRTLLEVQLIEVSAVTFPAYNQTNVAIATAMRSRVDLHDDVEAVERRSEFWPELPELCGVQLTKRTIIDLGSLASNSQTPPDDAGDTQDAETAPCSCGGGPLISMDAARAAFLDALRQVGTYSADDIRAALAEERGAISYQHTETSDRPWDAAANEKNVPNDATARTLRQVYAWSDPKGNGKSGYKFPHHFVSADGTPGAASTVACSAGIAALNGGRGGADIPAADKTAVHSHLSHHLKDAGMTPPSLKPEMNSSEPPESTRDETDDAPVEPAASTQPLAPSPQDRMRALAARYHLRSA